MFIKILKSIGAVLAGFMVVFILSVVTDIILEKSGVFPPLNQPESYLWWMYLLALIYRTIYTILGGYITAILAPNQPMSHVIILGIIGVILSTIGTIVNWNKMSASDAWYPVLLIVLAFPSVWLGGILKLKKII